ncbi:nitrate/nitrite transporter NrtS [Pseudomonadota bacterium]|nr:nitrate/nitrite transporter NrtS [Pseudomonadota bacterium]
MQLFKFKRLLNHFLQWKWFVVALVVGSILNLINQPDALFGEQSVHYPKLILTYCVPYLVSSISAWCALNSK